MRGEYEIPAGSKLYFKESARKKRAIEGVCVAALEAAGYEEIVTPAFSYHMSLSRENAVIRFGDRENHAVALRADTSLEAVRLIQKRLGRANSERKWFYVQPVFRYPSEEIYQVGGESIGAVDCREVMGLAGEMLSKLNVQATLQIGNIRIPPLVSELLNLDPEVLNRHEVHQLLEMNTPWVTALVHAHTVEDMKALLPQVPDVLKPELDQLIRTAESVRGGHPVALAPLYHAQMEYYDGVFFRYLKGNALLATGGEYQSDGDDVAGFALFTDALIPVSSL